MIKERVNWVDWARVIGIWLVVLGHMYNYDNSVILRIVIYGFHMPLFFFLSGFFHRESKTMFSNVRKHFETLIVPFIIFQLLFILLYGTINYLTGSNISLTEDTLTKTAGLFSKVGLSLSEDSLLVNYAALFIRFVGGVIKHHSTPNGPTWFLLVLFYIKIMMDIFLKLRFKYKEVLVILMLVVLYFGNNILNPLYINSALMAFPFYYLGYVLFPKLEKLKPSVTVSLSLFVFFIACSIGLTHTNGLIVSMFMPNWGNNILLFYLNGLIGSAGIIALSYAFNSKHYNIMTQISMATLLILCLHYPVCMATFTTLDHLEIFGFPRMAIFSIVSFAVLLICAPLYRWMMKHIPFVLGKFKH